MISWYYDTIQNHGWNKNINTAYFRMSILNGLTLSRYYFWLFNWRRQKTLKIQSSSSGQLQCFSMYWLGIGQLFYINIEMKTTITHLLNIWKHKPKQNGFCWSLLVRKGRMFGERILCQSCHKFILGHCQPLPIFLACTINVDKV